MVDSGIKLRGTGHAQGQRLAPEREGLTACKPRRFGRCLRHARLWLGCENQGVVGDSLVELKIQAAGGGSGHALKQLTDHNRRVQQAQQRRTALLHRGQVGALGVQRHIKEHTRGMVLVLHQHDGAGHDGLARVHRLLCRRAAHHVGADVQTHGADVAIGRFNELDDQKIFVFFVKQLANSELGRTVSLLSGHKVP